MFKIYGKGDTVSNSEFWDGRTNNNFLQDFLSAEHANFLDLVQPIKEIIAQQYEVFDFLERINDIKLLHYGILKDSFYQEFKMTSDDVVSVNILGKTKHYVRLPPGIAVFNKNIYLHKPAVVLGSKQLDKVFEMNRADLDALEIKYDFLTDTFKCKISRKIEKNEPAIIMDYPNKSWDKDDVVGFKHSAKLLEALYNDPNWERFFINKVGDDLTKINIEKLIELTQNGIYYWVLTEDGNVELTQNIGTNLKLCSFQYDNGIISNIDNTHHLYQTWGQPQIDTDGSILFQSPNGLKFIDETGSNIILKNNGEITISNGTASILFNGRSIEIDGDFNVTGTSQSTGTATLTVSSNIIEINDGITGLPPVGLKSGLLIHRGDLPIYHFIFDEEDLTLKGGYTNELKAVSQRELTPISTGVPFWDAVEKIFKTTDLMKWNGAQLVVDVDRIDGLHANDNSIEDNNTTLATKNKVKAYVDARDTIIQTELTTHRNNVNNPHSVTQSQVGLGNVPNWTGSTNVNLGSSNSHIPSQYAVKTYVDALDGRIPWTHFTNTSNPHTVTKAQTGLGNVPNWKPLDTTNRTPSNWQGSVFDDEFVSAALIKGYIDYRFLGVDFTHFGNTSNPHSVTKAQVGLGNVPNWTGIITTFGTPTDLQFPSAKLVKDYVDNRIENHDGEHEDLFFTKAQINTTVDGINTSISNQNTTINNRIDTEVSTLNSRITTEVGTLNTKINTEVGTLNTAINILDTRVTTEVSNLNTIINTNDARVTTEVGTLNATITAETIILDTRITTEVGTLNGRINTEVSTLNTKITTDINTASATINNRIDTEVSTIQGKLDLKANQLTTYTKIETNNLLDGKSNTGHTHTATEINDSTLFGRNLIKTTHVTTGIRFLRAETNGTVGLRTAANVLSDIGAEPVFIKNTAFNKNFGDVVGTVCQGNDSRLSNDRIPLIHGNDKHTQTYIEEGDSRLSNDRIPLIHGDDKHSETYIKEGDNRLTNDRIPIIHGNDKHTQIYIEEGDDRLTNDRTPTIHNHNDLYYIKSEIRLAIDKLVDAFNSTTFNGSKIDIPINLNGFLDDLFKYILISGVINTTGEFDQFIDYNNEVETSIINMISEAEQFIDYNNEVETSIINMIGKADLVIEL